MGEFVLCGDFCCVGGGIGGVYLGGKCGVVCVVGIVSGLVLWYLGMCFW